MKLAGQMLTCNAVWVVTRCSNTKPFHLKQGDNEVAPVSSWQCQSLASLLTVTACTLLQVLQPDWDWGLCFAPCVLFNRTGMLRPGPPGLVLLRAALELSSEVWSGWMQSKRAFKFYLAMCFSGGWVCHKSCNAGGQDLWIRQPEQWVVFWGMIYVSQWCCFRSCQ